jgi:uncharacterized membrane protein (DUF106 family)
MTITETILLQSPLLLIIGFSFLVTIISVLAYKFFTNQAEMKQLKEDMKAHQKEMKEHRHDQKKMMEIQKKSMEKNLRYMQHSFKPMIFTFLPIILLFGWLNANIAYEPLLPGQEFNVTVVSNSEYNFSILPNETINVLNKSVSGDATTYTLSGQEGRYTMFFDSPNETQKTAELVITEKQEYRGPVFKFRGNGVKTVTVSNMKMRPFGRAFNIGGYYPGWFMTYFVSAIVFNSILRKIFKVY